MWFYQVPSFIHYGVICVYLGNVTEIYLSLSGHLWRTAGATVPIQRITWMMCTTIKQYHQKFAYCKEAGQGQVLNDFPAFRRTSHKIIKEWYILLFLNTWWRALVTYFDFLTRLPFKLCEILAQIIEIPLLKVWDFWQVLQRHLLIAKEFIKDVYQLLCWPATSSLVNVDRIVLSLPAG